MNQPFRFAQGEKGFSLVESILVLSIAGLLALAAMPKDDPLVPLNLDAAARRVTADLRYAQDMATTSSEAHGFRVTGNSTYEVYNVVTGAIVDSPYTHELMQEDLGESYGNMVFASLAYQIEFDDEGKPSLGGGTIIQVTNGSSMRQIEITTQSGYVRLF